jgi:hypothetical protein
MEVVMDALTFFIVFTLLRLIIPVGLLLLVGTWVQRHAGVH